MKSVIREIEVGGTPCRFRVSAPGYNGPETLWFWPVTADYGLYDDALYQEMTEDEARNVHYRRAIAELVPGKSVVDIGTGADAIWALECVRAGATKVYAIEAGRAAYEKAKKKLKGIERVELIQGFSSDITLPEKVDLCVSEILGEIGSSEGCIPVLDDVRKRMLKPDGRFIPERCASPIAAIRLPDHLAEAPAFDEESLPYVEAALHSAGKPQDLRVNLGFDLSQVHRVSDTAYLEDIDFRSFTHKPQSEVNLQLTVSESGPIHGLVSWLHLSGRHHDPPLDTLEQTTNWYPVFWPVFWPAELANEGDTISATVKVSYPEGQWSPDYAISGQLSRADQPPMDFSMSLPSLVGEYRAEPFYRDLFLAM